MELKDEYKKMLDEFLSEIEKTKAAIYTDDGSVIARGAILHYEGYMNVAEALRWVFERVKVDSVHRFLSTIIAFFVCVKELEIMNEKESKRLVREWMRGILY